MDHQHHHREIMHKQKMYLRAQKSLARDLIKTMSANNAVIKTADSKSIMQAKGDYKKSANFLKSRRRMLKKLRATLHRKNLRLVRFTGKKMK